jgi:putative transposase
MVHHVVNRGNRKAVIFRKRADFKAFLDLLSQAVGRSGMRVIAFCLMRNHWHFVLWPREADALSAFMHWLTSTHVRRYHAHYGLTGTGHLYQDRYRNDICRDDRGVLAVMRYVEGNPLAAGLVTRAEHYEWSSLAFRARGDDYGILAPPPIELPANWVRYVNDHTPRRRIDTPSRDL